MAYHRIDEKTVEYVDNDKADYIKEDFRKKALELLENKLDQTDKTEITKQIRFSDVP